MQSDFCYNLLRSRIISLMNWSANEIEKAKDPQEHFFD